MERLVFDIKHIEDIGIFVVNKSISFFCEKTSEL